MPGFDRSGPMGLGQMTGGQRGYCNPANTGYGIQSAPFGFGRCMGHYRGFRAGFGQGMRRGFGRRVLNQPLYSQAYAQKPEEEIDMLKAEANYVKNCLDMINQKIAELEKPSE
jgi:hypothetical protein